MNRGISPEDLYSKLLELEDNDDELAITLVQEFIKGTKKRSWSKSMNELMKKAIEIIISQGQIKPFKEVISFCRSLTQTNYILQFENIIKTAKEFLSDKYEISNEKFKKFQNKQNIILEEEADINEENITNMKDIIDEQQFINDQKFIWEAYKTLLDITKMNSKLFQLYNEILKDCFTFCGENRRIHEFKALCDSIRNYLFMLKKNENKPNFANKINITEPKVLRLLIQSCIAQIETANKLEEWEESFKTSEKIVSFIEDYEKIEIVREKPGNKKGEKEKKFLKIPPFFEIELYNHIQKLLWVSNYPLYHTYAMISIKKTLENNKNRLDNLNKKEQQIFSTYNLDKLNERIILAFLSTPIKNAYTNFSKIGEELYEESNDTEIRTCQRMMKILKLNHIPSRKYLLGYLLNNKIVNNTKKEIKELFDVFENEQNPILLAKKGVKYIKSISNEEEYKPYIRKIEENLVIKVLMLMPTVYKNISLSRVINLFKDLNVEEYEINDIITESSRMNLFRCKIDIRNNLIKFVTNDSSQDKFNNIIENFLKSSKKVIKDIIWSKNKSKLNIIKDKLYEEIRNNNSKSLVITNTLLEESKKQNKKLKNYINKRDALKRELKIKTAETKEKTLQLMQDKEQLEKDKLRSEQEQRELEAEMKRYLIDSLRTFTNSIILKDGKRIKLDDLLKDLNKITPEELIKHYDEQKIESASKKEKELKKDTIRKDYILREFRKRDMEKYEQEKIKDIELMEIKRQEEIEKELQVRDEVLKYKEYKDNYCVEIEKKNLEDYKNEVELYNKYLKDKVTEDIYKELDSFFAVYLDEFNKKQMAENQQKKALDTWTPFDMNKKKIETLGRGTQFTDVKVEKKVDIGWQRSARANENKEADKLKQSDDFQRGSKFEENKKNEGESWRKKDDKNKDERNKKKDDKDEGSWRRGPDKKEDKKYETKKDDKKKKETKKDTKKSDNKNQESWRRGEEPKKEDKKHDNKKEESWRRGEEPKKEDKKHDNKKEEGKKEENWRRGEEPKREDKKHEVKKDNKKNETKQGDNWRRGEEAKKEEKKKTESKKEDNWRRGTEEPKKEDKKEETKKEDNWRRGDVPKKEEKKEEPKKEEKKEEPKKEDTWRRGEEPKKEEKKNTEEQKKKKKNKNKKKK